MNKDVEIMIANEGCWERGCACHSALESAGVELVAKKEWVGLTNQEIREEWFMGNDYDDFARHIEAKLKEKNEAG